MFTPLENSFYFTQDKLNNKVFNKKKELYRKVMLIIEIKNLHFKI